MVSYNRWCLLMTPSRTLSRKRYYICILCGAINMINAGEMHISENTGNEDHA